MLFNNLKKVYTYITCQFLQFKMYIIHFISFTDKYSKKLYTFKPIKYICGYALKINKIVSSNRL